MSTDMNIDQRLCREDHAFIQQSSTGMTSRRGERSILEVGAGEMDAEEEIDDQLERNS